MLKISFTVLKWSSFFAKYGFTTSTYNFEHTASMLYMPVNPCFVKSNNILYNGQKWVSDIKRANFLRNASLQMLATLTFAGCVTFSLTSTKGKFKCFYFSSQGKQGGGEGEKARPDKNGDGPGRALHSRWARPRHPPRYHPRHRDLPPLWISVLLLRRDGWEATELKHNTQKTKGGR